MRLILLLMAALSPDLAAGSNTTEAPSPESQLTRASSVPSPLVHRSSVTPKPRRRGKVDSPMLNYIFDSYATSNKHFHDKFRAPSFEGNVTSQDTVVDADTGATVVLDCHVSSLRDKTVSWLRVSDDEKLELLTLDLDRHSADPRYRVDVAGDNWKMLLSNAKSQDSGVYCCHVSTHPPMLKRFKLVVHPPQIKLSREAFLESGETLSLKCSILHLCSGDEVPELRWYRGNSSRSLDEVRGGVLVETDHLTMTSHLQVAHLKTDDAGNYTCSLQAPIVMNATTRVHVLQGSSLAELQSGVKTSKSYISSMFLCTLINIWSQYTGLR